MKTIFTKRGRIMSLVLMCALILTMVAPISAFAAPEDYQIQVEYSATQAGDISVPDTLSFGGYDYKLLSKTDPVLGSTLPVNRTYSYRIAGDVDEEGLASIQKMLPDAKLNFTSYEYNKVEGDIVKTVDNLMINDASLLASDFTEGGVNYALKTIDWSKDASGDRVSEVPRSSWTATATYEGYEPAKAYTLADVTYTSKNTLADAYVVVATYEPANPVTEPTTADGDTPAVAPVAPQTPDNTANQTDPAAEPAVNPAADPANPADAEAAPPADSVVDVTTPETPLVPGPVDQPSTDNPDVQVPDGTTPLAPGAEAASTSWLADNYGWLVGAVALLVIIIVGIILISRKRRTQQD